MVAYYTLYGIDHDGFAHVLFGDYDKECVSDEKMEYDNSEEYVTVKIKRFSDDTQATQDAFFNSINTNPAKEVLKKAATLDCEFQTECPEEQDVFYKGKSWVAAYKTINLTDHVFIRLIYQGESVGWLYLVNQGIGYQEEIINDYANNEFMNKLMQGN